MYVDKNIIEEIIVGGCNSIQSAIRTQVRKNKKKTESMKGLK